MINYSSKVNERLIGATITNESHTIGITGVAVVTPGLIRLVEVPQAPSPLSTVSIPGYNEITSGSPTGTQFLVDYTTGVITFNVSQDGNSILVSYIGLGSEIAAEDINELQGPVGIALNYNGSLSNNIVKPASISNTGTDDFTFPRDVTVARNLTTLEITSASVNSASSGVIRLAHSDTIAWRNFANSGDDILASDGSDDLTWKGNVIATGSGAVTSITGTSNQIIASSSVGAITLSTPQDIGVASSVTFGQIIDSGLTASTVPYANGSKQLTSSSVTPTELGYLSGVTSAIQTQLNGKASLALSNLSSVAINTSLLPGTDASINLGSSSFRWQNLLLSDTALVGGTSIDPSAIVDLQSTTKGFLPPRMTTTQRDAISSPATGLLIYNTTNNQWEGWQGSGWSILG